MHPTSTVLLSLILLLASPTVAQEFVPNLTEVQGQRELSGWMIARPLQVADAVVEGMGPQQAAALADAGLRTLSGFTILEYIPQTDEYLFRLPERTTERQVIEALMKTGSFDYVEPDWYLYPLATPNDSRYSGQWHHQPSRMQSADAWDIHTGGTAVTVGICDTGVRTSHEDLLLNRQEGYNAVDRVWESAGGSIGAVHPHGTQTTGCAAANGNNGVGVSGVGWNLSHRMMRVTNRGNGGAYSSDLRHAARTSIEAGDRVASVSYSGPDSASNLTTATYIKSIGGLLIWAAGNDSRNLNFGDRDADDLIVVGATTSGDGLASFSAYGAFVDLTAPGSGVLTTGSRNNSRYDSVSGTSFSCPLTAGLAALIWSADPNLTPNQVEAILKSGVDDLGTGGVDAQFGYGRINSYGSLVLVAGPPTPTAPTASFSGTPTSGTSPLTVQFNDQSSDTPTSWSWDFGDGNVSTAQHPSNIYATQGDYTVTLTATNAQGSDTMVRSNYVSVTAPGSTTGSGFILSKDPGFATSDTIFSRSDTLYMKVWNDQFDVGNMRWTWWKLKKGPGSVQQNFVNHGDGTFTASFALTNLPTSATSWGWSARVEDYSGVSLRPKVTITVNP